MKTSFFILILLINPSFAWDHFGHETVAEIAFLRLQEESPQTAQKLDNIVVHDFRPGRGDLLRFATWPDFLKHPPKNPPAGFLTGAHKLSNWHFVDIPYDASPAEITDVIELSQVPVDPGQEQTGNVVRAIRFFADTVSHSHDEHELADSLSYLIHFVGDVHQPLHCVTVLNSLTNYDVSDAADRGGNGFHIKGQGKIGNLHSFWDDQEDLAVRRTGHEDDPMHPDHTAVKNRASVLMQHFPISHFSQELAIVDPAVWARESFDIHQRVYAPRENGRLGSQYVQFATTTADERVTLAGYRLARVLENILQNQ